MLFLVGIFPIGKSDRAYALEQCFGQREIGEMPDSVNCYEVCYRYLKPWEGQYYECYYELRSVIDPSRVIDTCAPLNISVPCWKDQYHSWNATIKGDQ